MNAARRGQHTGERGKHDEGHDARLHQLDEFADTRFGNVSDPADLAVRTHPLHSIPPYLIERCARFLFDIHGARHARWRREDCAS
jgi:hypothetical protein